mmetsp:Transcript_690/g.1754  ORF Transcript_690/g.1754 Transcript_690/m.1754 type:complete len:300 (+) Transcript_690:697-1596(+)
MNQIRLPRQLLHHPCDPIHICFEVLSHSGVLYLHGHIAPIAGQARSVHLAHACRTQGVVVESTEDLFHGSVQGLANQGAHLRSCNRWRVALQLLELNDVLPRQAQVREERHQLSYLYEDTPELSHRLHKALGDYGMGATPALFRLLLRHGGVADPQFQKLEFHERRNEEGPNARRAPEHVVVHKTVNKKGRNDGHAEDPEATEDRASIQYEQAQQKKTASEAEGNVRSDAFPSNAIIIRWQFQASPHNTRQATSDRCYTDCAIRHKPSESHREQEDSSNTGPLKAKVRLCDPVRKTETQ